MKFLDIITEETNRVGEGERHSRLRKPTKNR